MERKSSSRSITLEMMPPKPPMDKPMLILGAIIEIVALIVIVRLWMRRPSRVVSSVFWSLVLLVPFFGLFLYFFLREEPPAHGEHVADFGSGGGDGGGSHDGGGGGH